MSAHPTTLKNLLTNTKEPEMKTYKSAIFIIIVFTLTGCGDNFSCENEEVLKSVNEAIVSSAVNERDFRTFRPYSQSGLTGKAVTVDWDSPARPIRSLRTTHPAPASSRSRGFCFYAFRLIR